MTGLAWQVEAQARSVHCLRLNDVIIDPVTGGRREVEHASVVTALSPNGRFSVARRFGMDGNSNTVVLVDHAGGEETVLGENADRVSWSSDGTQFAFLSRQPETRAMSLAVGSVKNGVVRTVEITVTSGQRASLRLHGFSADRQYAAVSVQQSSKSYVVFYALSDLSETSVFAGSDAIRGFKWSPTGHQAGFVGLSSSNRTTAHVAPADASWHVGYEIEGNGEFIDFVWSPDDRHVAVASRRSLSQWVDIVSPNGVLAHFDGPLASGWTTDGSAILAWQQTGRDELRYDLIRFETATRQREPVARDVFGTYDLSADGRLLLAPVWQAGTSERLALTLFRLDAGTRHQIAEMLPTSVHRGIRVYWPPEGSTLALVHRVAYDERITQTEIRVRTATLAAESSGDYGNISTPLWMRGGDAYIQWRYRDGSTEVVWFDPNTGQEKLLTIGMARIDVMTLDEQTGNVYYRWQDVRGRSGVDLIAPDGTRLTRWEALGDTAGVDEGGFPVRIVLSPDNRQAVIDSVVDGQVVTQLFPARGSPVELASTGTIPLHWTANWSPDGSMFAYYSIAENQASTAYIVDSGGREIARFDAFPNLMSTGRMDWVMCAG